MAQIFGRFDRMYLVEKIGSGVPRMDELMELDNLNPPEYRKEGMFTVVLLRPAKADVNQEKSPFMPESQALILKLIRGNNSISIQELSHAVGISEPAIDKNIKKLKEIGLLERIGGKKDGKWRLL